MHDNALGLDEYIIYDILLSLKIYPQMDFLEVIHKPGDSFYFQNIDLDWLIFNKDISA